MVALYTECSNIKRVLTLNASIAPMYLVQDETTGLFGVQTIMGKFEILPKYQLNDKYDLTKKYAVANVNDAEKLVLIEHTRAFDNFFSEKISNNDTNPEKENNWFKNDAQRNLLHHFLLQFK